MISTCPHCGRAVASDEWLARDRSGRWIPTACASGDGPTCATGQELVRNHQHWYVSALNPDDGRRVCLLGPFQTYDEAKSQVRRGQKLAFDCGDHRAPWYAYGVASSAGPTPLRTAFGV